MSYYTRKVINNLANSVVEMGGEPSGKKKKKKKKPAIAITISVGTKH